MVAVIAACPLDTPRPLGAPRLPVVSAERSGTQPDAAEPLALSADRSRPGHRPDTDHAPPAVRPTTPVGASGPGRVGSKKERLCPGTAPPRAGAHTTDPRCPPSRRQRGLVAPTGPTRSRRSSRPRCTPSRPSSWAARWPRRPSRPSPRRCPSSTTASPRRAPASTAPSQAPRLSRPSRPSCPNPTVADATSLVKAADLQQAAAKARAKSVAAAAAAAPAAAPRVAPRLTRRLPTRRPPPRARRPRRAAPCRSCPARSRPASAGAGDGRTTASTSPPRSAPPSALRWPARWSPPARPAASGCGCGCATTTARSPRTGTSTARSCGCGEQVAAGEEIAEVGNRGQLDRAAPAHGGADPARHHRQPAPVARRARDRLLVLSAQSESGVARRLVRSGGSSAPLMNMCTARILLVASSAATLYASDSVG